MTKRLIAITLTTNIIVVALLVLIHINVIKIPDEFIAITANLTSLMLWMPQAISVWYFRTNKEALKGISLLTQILVIINTLAWCEHGFRRDDLWLSLGTVFILPLASLIVFLKVKSLLISDEVVEKEQETWFTFAAYRMLNSADKVRCLKAMYNSDFKNSTHKERLNWESYEEMSDLDKMYWDRELWLENYPDKSKK